MSAAVLEEPVAAGQRSRSTGVRRVDVPVPAEAAERLGRLVGLHHRRIVHYLFVRVDDWALAEDLAQDLWLDLAMRPYEMDGWNGTDADSFPLLAYRARQRIHQHLRLRMNEREQLLGAARADDDRSVEERMDALMGPGPEDETECAVLEMLGENEAPAFSACWARAMTVLSKRQRQVIELRCEGMTTRAIADRMGDSHGNVTTHLRAAVKVLRDPQEIARRLGRQEAERLPDGWEKVLAKLPSRQAEVTRLKSRGWTVGEIARLLELDPSTVSKALRSAVRKLQEMVVDQRMDPVQAPPAREKRPGSGVVRVPAPTPAATAQQKSACHFAPTCAAGCSLRGPQAGAGVAA
jgi:RNA polymerase sigma factor (sigma-70 family)